MKKTITGAALWLGVAAAGCEGPATPENFAGEYEEALCAWASGCSVFQARGQCRDALVWDTSGRFQYLLEAVDAGRVGFDAAAAEACLEQVSAQVCDGELLNAVLFSTGPAAAPEVCHDVFVGKVRNYDPCLNSEECAGDNAVCGFNPAGCPDNMCCAGACRVLGGPPEIGEPCTGSCGDDAFCAFDPNTGQPTVCTARRGEGKPCDDDFNACQAALYCDSSEFKCKPRGDSGASCEYSNSCAEGLECYSYPNGERSCQTLPGEGQSCSNNNYPACARYDNYCDPNGTCRKLPLPGEPCLDWNCVPYAVCATNAGSPVCVRRGSLDSDCGPSTGYTQCIGHLFCENDRCVEPDPEPVCSLPE
ncbi:hypothetical protein [Nannocystis radixulma]|uniref:Dickkopf N-terminal cysteine-rich domain-containing protein n=1 Tax=Nannocystis radixulma TaxID=2995305 RepID=A0ABT5B5C0_9BACT|nr:hypothetical protein [Nannocystis radixulma]MDC0669330.1 hypothetical protein [Nannocystis radixulma]